jgi:Cytochrome c7 and related cytochrome c
MNWRFAVTKLAALLLFAVLASLGATSSGMSANPLQKLMMPGELSNAHAKLEEECSNCHKLLVKKAQSDLCLSCHKQIKSDVDAKSGFHGKNPIVAKSECYGCHVEHKGRDHSIVQLEPIIFDHADTNFPLLGGHKKVECASCHVTGNKYREAPHTCFACHEKDQPHKGNLGKACETCHVVESWKKVAIFDHDKTKFALRGGHAKATCIGCHVGEIYKELSMACNDCHAIQDVHGGKFGPLCQDCHSVESWRDAKFDHAKQTKFALIGAHAKAKCSDCHGGNVREKIAMECITCHKAQDVHKAQLGNACGDCHGTVAWRLDVKFDHGLTDFPLTGLHIAVACEACHASSAFKGAPRTCIGCHKKDDTHEGRFMTKCESCHSTMDWKRISFDHGHDAKYELTGAHASIGCYACHTAKNVTSVKLPTTCIACHKAQDVHHGGFGEDCAKCHTTNTFKSAFIRQ